MKILTIIASADREGGGPIEGVLQMAAVLETRHGRHQELLTLDQPGGRLSAGFSVARPRAGIGGARWAAGALDALVSRARSLGRRRMSASMTRSRSRGCGTSRRWWRGGTLVGGPTPYLVYTHGMLDPWFKRRYQAQARRQAGIVAGQRGRAAPPRRRGGVHVRAGACARPPELRARTTFNERVVRFGTADPPPRERARNAAAFAAAAPGLRRSDPISSISAAFHEEEGV